MIELITNQVQLVNNASLRDMCVLWGARNSPLMRFAKGDDIDEFVVGDAWRTAREAIGWAPNDLLTEIVRIAVTISNNADDTKSQERLDIFLEQLEQHKGANSQDFFTLTKMLFG